MILLYTTTRRIPVVYATFKNKNRPKAVFIDAFLLPDVRAAAPWPQAAPTGIPGRGPV